MIYVTQGHEKGIGVEVFLKAFLCLTSDFQKQFLLIINEKTLIETAKICQLNIKINNSQALIENSYLELFLLQENEIPQTTNAMNIALEKINHNDILLTLPSSKDQFLYNGGLVNGHTEFFRKYFNNEEIGMCFLGKNTNVLLLSDHIAIDEINKYISQDNLIFNKISATLKTLEKIRPIKEVFLSGINPHCGENGLISNTDDILRNPYQKLINSFKDIKFNEIMSGDTLHFHMRDKFQLFVYTFHDQGLAPFKLKYGLSGINFTTGLPFKRVSVDHGTSFNLYGKNSANYLGMLYLLSEIEDWT